MAVSPLRRVWQGMIRRCYDPRFKEYRNYGARGISVCDRWRTSFEAFSEDMSPRPNGLSIDRINNDGNYEPGNCRWATRTQQNRNTRANHVVQFDGARKSIAEWADELGVPAKRIRARINTSGWDATAALTRPRLTNVGSGHPRARLNEDAVRRIRSDYGHGTPVSKLAENYRVSQWTVYEVVSRRRWKHVS